MPSCRAYNYCSTICELLSGGRFGESASLINNPSCVYVGMQKPYLPKCRTTSMAGIDQLHKCGLYDKYGFHWTPFGNTVKTPDLRYPWYRRKERNCLMKNGQISYFIPGGCFGSAYEVNVNLFEKLSRNATHLKPWSTEKFLSKVCNNYELHVVFNHFSPMKRSSMEKNGLLIVSLYKTLK